MVATASGLVPIESLEVGDRVLNEDGGSETAVEGDWAVVEFDQPNPDVFGDVVRVTLLRSREWFEELGAFAPGDEVYLDTGELGALGWATVRSIRTSSPVAEGEGRVVVGTFTHVNPDVRELRFVGTDVTIRATGSHRFYSLDRLDWVATSELGVGERVQSEQGPLVVASVVRLPDPQRVYNIEVETDHEYLVSELGVRSHNSDGCPDLLDIDGDLFDELGINPFGDTLSLSVPSATNGSGRSFITYAFRDSAGRVTYVGRASGPGTPVKVLADRIRKGHDHFREGLTAHVIDVQGTKRASQGAEEFFYQGFRQRGEPLTNAESILSFDRPARTRSSLEKIEDFFTDLFRRARGT
jgi:hypothetical protein